MASPEDLMQRIASLEQLVGELREDNRQLRERLHSLGLSHHALLLVADGRIPTNDASKHIALARKIQKDSVVPSFEPPPLRATSEGA